MTRITHYAFLASIVVFLAGCASNDDAAIETTPEKSTATTIPDQSNIPPEKRLRVGPPSAKAPEPEEEVSAVTFGRGIATLDGLDVTFMHNVTRYKVGTAGGEFKQSAMMEAGTVDIDAEVTCAELDSKSGKGWIGGTVTRNDSTNPEYAGAAGADVWFRVLDLGAKEQTAFISMPIFQQKNIKDAATFCKKKPWSDKDLLEIKTGALAIFP